MKMTVLMSPRVPGGGAAPGQLLRVTADLGGGWRPGYTGSQWDSSTRRTPAELRGALEAAHRGAGFAIIDAKVGRDDLSPVTVKYIQAAAERSKAPPADRRPGGSHHGRLRA